MNTKRIVVALGGNALGSTPEEQLSLIRLTASTIVDLIEQGHDVVITHGNGPQVGMIKAVTDVAHAVENTPVMPFPECGALSQGYIGYHLQQAIDNELKKREIAKDCLSIVTQTLVDSSDPAFQKPTKPIGSFLSEEEARREMETTDKVYVEDAGRGWRWVVASPSPVRIIESDVIGKLVNSGVVVVASGGGGIPVVDEAGQLSGIPAVIDKDRSAAVLARDTGADTLLILTATDAAYRDYGKPTQSPIRHMSLEECRQAIDEGIFAEGSMKPKVEACVEFIGFSPDGEAIITSLERAGEAFDGSVGTRITSR